MILKNIQLITVATITTMLATSAWAEVGGPETIPQDILEVMAKLPEPGSETYTPTQKSEFDVAVSKKSPYVQWTTRSQYVKNLESQLKAKEKSLASASGKKRKANLTEEIARLKGVIADNKTKIEMLETDPEVAKKIGKEVPVAETRAITVPELPAAKPIAPDCQSGIRNYFSAEANQPAVKSFLDLQAKLTLHRMSWAYLSAAKDDPSVKNLEEGILGLVKKKYGPTASDSSDVGSGKAFASEAEKKSFIQARDQFENAPLSRQSLADIAPHVTSILEKQAGQGENVRPYLLTDSDLKMLQLLAEKDGGSAFSKDRAKSASVLNLTKLVDGGLQGKKLTPESIAAGKKKLEAQIKGVEAQMDAKLATMAASISACAGEDSRQAMCKGPDSKPVSVDNLLADCKDAIAAMYDGIALRNDRHDSLKYGDLWAKIPLEKIVPPTSTTVMSGPAAEPARTVANASCEQGSTAPECAPAGAGTIEGKPVFGATSVTSNQLENDLERFVRSNDPSKADGAGFKIGNCTVSFEGTKPANATRCSGGTPANPMLFVKRGRDIVETSCISYSAVRSGDVSSSLYSNLAKECSKEVKSLPPGVVLIDPPKKAVEPKKIVMSKTPALKLNGGLKATVDSDGLTQKEWRPFFVTKAAGRKPADFEVEAKEVAKVIFKNQKLNIGDHVTFNNCKVSLIPGYKEPTAAQANQFFVRVETNDGTPMFAPAARFQVENFTGAMATRDSYIEEMGEYMSQHCAQPPAGSGQFASGNVRYKDGGTGSNSGNTVEQVKTVYGEYLRSPAVRTPHLQGQCQITTVVQTGTCDQFQATGACQLRKVTIQKGGKTILDGVVDMQNKKETPEFKQLVKYTAENC